MKYARIEQIRTRLDKESNDKYRKLVLKSGKTSTEVAREAILFYIENHEQVDSKEFENTYRDDLKKIYQSHLLVACKSCIGHSDSGTFYASDYG